MLLTLRLQHVNFTLLTKFWAELTEEASDDRPDRLVMTWESDDNRKESYGRTLDCARSRRPPL